MFGLGFRLAGVLLSFASPKESKQRKGDPWVGVGLHPIPCATRRAGRLAKLACGSDNASRLHPARLRCSAPLKGPGKPSELNRCSAFLDFLRGRPQQPIFVAWRLCRDAFPGPHVARRATQVRPGEVGEDCLRAAGPSSAAPGPYRVAQGSRRSRPHNLGSPSFWLLFLGEARKSTPAPQARKPLPIAKRR